MKKWELFEQWICIKLQAIDRFVSRTPGSGNKGRKGDIITDVGLHIECKQRATDSVTIKADVWQKLNEEIPLHSNKIPMLALENKNGKRWAVLDLETFLDIYIEYYDLKKRDDNV